MIHYFNNNSTIKILRSRDQTKNHFLSSRRGWFKVTNHHVSFKKSHTHSVKLHVFEAVIVIHEKGERGI
jgi:hypothetical protein